MNAKEPQPRPDRKPAPPPSSPPPKGSGVSKRPATRKPSMMKLTDKEAREKRHNPWYCKVCRKLVYISYGITGIEKDPAVYNVPFCPVCGSVDVVEKPERETPEEFEDRTGRPWSDDSAVYIKLGENNWRIVSYREAKFDAECCRMDNVPYQIYCANSDAGIPGEEAEHA